MSECSEAVAIERVVPALQKYLDLSDKDRMNTMQVLKEQKEATKELRDCISDLRVQIQDLKTHKTMFDLQCQERKEDCSVKFGRIEQKLKDIPDPEALKSSRQDVQTLVKTVEDLKIKVYVAAGVVVFAFGFLKWVYPIMVQ